ncbi:MAG TPA: Fe-S cluster assembly protein SufD, partial [Candidatus Glassbacteria bacterium]|nr:Fe-S cluster assembly protein SufD [Candidatus Glassbacteria bacterium]
SLDKLPDRAAGVLELAGTSSAGRLVHVDGSSFSGSLSHEAQAAGVIFTDLESAANDHEKLLRERLGRLVGPSDVFNAFNLALHRGGTFLYVPAGAELTAPLQSLHWLVNSGALVQPRTVVVVEPGAKVVFNDVYASGPLDKPTLVNPVTEVYIAEGAQVGWVTWQDWGPGVRHLSTVKATLARNAKLNTLLVTLGGDFSRTWKECVLAGEGAESIMLGLYFSHQEQHFEHWTLQDHAAARTRSDLLYKGALADTSRTVYYGTIKVRPEARLTDAYQANRNLALSPKAKADTNPQLEIENNDVRCTHGATVGRVDEEHLFYLTSRGLKRKDAERLLIFGFFNEVLERVEWSGMHDVLADSILKKLEGGE